MGADPTWLNRARCSIPCDVTLGSGGGGRLGENPLAARERAAPVQSERAGLFFVVFSPYLYCCCSCFPLLVVLLNCPYPDPPVSACFFFHSPPHAGGGRGGRVVLLLPAAAETKTQGTFKNFI